MAKANETQIETTATDAVQTLLTEAKQKQVDAIEAWRAERNAKTNASADRKIAWVMNREVKSASERIITEITTAGGMHIVKEQSVVCYTVKNVPVQGFVWYLSPKYILVKDGVQGTGSKRKFARTEADMLLTLA